MKIHKITLSTSDVPEKLRNIPIPPKQLFVMGNNVNELLQRPCVTVVGSRKVSAYGKAVTLGLAGELAKAGVVIISGLALGVDSLAHKAALDAGGLTIAVLPSGIDRIYPASHQGLAKQILAQGGALVSEYPNDELPHKYHFIERNRIASGMGDALLVTEAAEKSGTLHTASFALEQGKPVLAVPGNITSPTSVGTNNLIKTGATPVTSAQDIMYALGLELTEAKKEAPRSSNPHEQILLDLLFSGVSDGTELLDQSELEVSLFNQTLTMLEIRGHIRPLGNNRWALT
ncbi:MAG TPA: DNA-processing protein DprA [Candidatus Saccharimonadales bacterium]